MAFKERRLGQPSLLECRVRFTGGRMLNEFHAAFHENERGGKRFHPDR